MTNTSRPGRYISSFPAADLLPGDYVLMDRINGYLKIDAVGGRADKPELTGHSEDGLTHTMTPTAPRVSAWVAHRTPVRTRRAKGQTSSPRAFG